MSILLTLSNSVDQCSNGGLGTNPMVKTPEQNSYFTLIYNAIAEN